LMGKAIVVLPPHKGGDQQIERGDRSTPGKLVALFQPFGVLIEHRINDVNKGLVAVDQTMAAAENVTLEPTFHGMFTEHLHDPAVGSQFSAVGVFREILAKPSLLADFVERLQLVGLCLVRAENPEVMHILAHNFAKEVAESWYVSGQCGPRFLYLNSRVTEIGHHKGFADQPAVRNRIGGHASVAFWR